MSKLFGISHGYYGAVLSNLARLHMTEAVEESNEKHLSPWSDACNESGVVNTPLTPYIDKVLDIHFYIYASISVSMYPFLYLCIHFYVYLSIFMYKCIHSSRSSYITNIFILMVVNWKLLDLYMMYHK